MGKKAKAPAKAPAPAEKPVDQRGKEWQAERLTGVRAPRLLHLPPFTLQALPESRADGKAIPRLPRLVCNRRAAVLGGRHRLLGQAQDCKGVHARGHRLHQAQPALVSCDLPRGMHHALCAARRVRIPAHTVCAATL